MYLIWFNWKIFSFLCAFMPFFVFFLQFNSTETIKAIIVNFTGILTGGIFKIISKILLPLMELFRRHKLFQARVMLSTFVQSYRFQYLQLYSGACCEAFYTIHFHEYFVLNYWYVDITLWLFFVVDRYAWQSILLVHLNERLKKIM